MKKTLIFLMLSILTGSIVNTVRAQDTVVRKIDYGKIDSLGSGVLKEKRLFEVFLPKAYKAGSTSKYDVLYVLDGGNPNTGLINEIQHFLESESYMPPTIIVSILNTDRNRDLTPTKVKDWETSGGADKFLLFIKSELIPYINKKYPSNGENTLWGHSFGGLFVTYALFNEPQTFKSYIAADPSLWWDNCYIQKIASDKLPALAGSNVTFFMGGRDGEGGRSMKIDTMSTILQKLAPAGLTWKSMVYPDETHGSVRLKSIYDGLKFSYRGFNNKADFLPMNGIIVKNKPIKIWYFNDTATVYYTVDGTVPAVSSHKMQKEVSLTAAGRFTAKNIISRSRYDHIATGDFVDGETLKPVSNKKNMKPGGFNYAYYEGNWDKWPAFKSLKNPVKTGLTDAAFNLDKIPEKNNHAVIVEGFLETKEEGYYVFILEDGEEAKLYLGNKLLMKMTAPNNQFSSYIVPLTKGFYPLRLESYHQKQGYKLKLSYMTPGMMQHINFIPIPLDLQYHKP
ncbi:putative alpha/beta superfamily hydrolase [Pedobacter cryoconitis]|uniref:Putative alpha/beta superfamily hydrolase n=1 Tax=Pedobacter cryoconitis TaxID=188932 RepID=A0A7W8ZN06_9SPHI|nr:alpha/beta hydrolase-fold protein [Pedobacter cryoconitis]MBB5636853.1 putative alpha/beta superfamily hydrolase [Pedobacter cryoconitis]